MQLCLDLTLYHHRSQIFSCSWCHWLKSCRLTISVHDLSHCVIFITVLLLQILCIIIIWTSHAAYGFLDLVRYITTPWVLQQHVVLCVTSAYHFNDFLHHTNIWFIAIVKSHLILTNILPEDFENIDFFITSFLYNEPTNAQLIDNLLYCSYMFQHDSVIFRELVVSTLPSYINRSEQSWWYNLQ